MIVKLIFEFILMAANAYLIFDFISSVIKYRNATDTREKIVQKNLIFHTIIGFIAVNIVGEIVLFGAPYIEKYVEENGFTQPMASGCSCVLMLLFALPLLTSRH